MNFIYKGVEYAEGTKVRINTYYHGEQVMIYHTSVYESGFYSDNPVVGHIKIFTTEVDNLPIVEIVEPVYPVKISQPPSPKKLPSDNDIVIGWFVYIAAMIFATFCYGNVVLWILISITFFTWKKGLWK